MKELLVLCLWTYCLDARQDRRFLFYRVISSHFNRPRSIYQYSNMAPRLSGQTSMLGVVFFVSKSLLGI